MARATVISYNLSDVSYLDAKAKGEIFFRAWCQFHTRERLRQIHARRAARTTSTVEA